jgi:hypothetical protein
MPQLVFRIREQPFVKSPFCNAPSCFFVTYNTSPRFTSASSLNIIIISITSDGFFFSEGDSGSEFHGQLR